MIRRFAQRLLRGFLHPDYYPDISGDLEELYLRNKLVSPTLADWGYFWQVILLLRPSLMRPLIKNPILKDTGMFRNYFKISIRSLLKQKAFSAINILGLAVGLAAFLLIRQYVLFERSYDTFFEEPGQLYRLTTDQVVADVLGTRDAMSFAPSGKALVEEIPEIIDATTTYKFDDLIFRNGESVTTEEKVLAVDDHFLDLFTYKVLSGSLDSLLAEPNTLVLSESKARYYFGEENPVGKTLYLQSAFERDFKVVAVIADPPENTHYKFNILMSLSTIRDRVERDGWDGYNYYTYVKLDHEADLEKVNSLMPALSQKYIGEGTTLLFHLQQVPDIHLYSDFTFEPDIHGNARAVAFLALISIFILVIAWVNYVNLSTARALDRAKEVGIRKVVGAQKKQLVIQFMLEAAVINFFGALLALGLAEVTLPYFNNLVGKEVLDHTWSSPTFLPDLAIFFLAGTVLSGMYPALVLSGFRPVLVLKGKFRNSGRGVLLRKGLVVLQFAASLALIASTLIVYQQVNYMRSRDLGMNIDQVIGFRYPRIRREEYEAQSTKRLALMDGLRKQSAVRGAGLISNLPGGGSSDISSNSGGIKLVGKTERLEATTYIQSFNEDAVAVLDMKILFGRNFDPAMSADTASVMVNEAFLKRFGLMPSDTLLGEKVQFGSDPGNDKFTIVGILKDANRSSLKNEVEPTVFFYDKTANYCVIRLDAQNLQAGLEAVQSAWESVYPGNPYKYSFLDERFEGLYQEDKRFGKVFGSFAFLALVVAMLGLFGLSSFMAVQRTKEVGVRKVLGASVVNIVSIFYRDFLGLILIAFAAGAPLIYYGMSSWLDGYAYRIDFPWLYLFASLGIVLALALLTVGYQVYKVAILNPARSLRYE